MLWLQGQAIELRRPLALACPPWRVGNVDRADALSQRPGETELVSIGVGQVEEPLAPFGVARHCVWAVAGGDHARMEGVNVGMAEDGTSPPRLTSLGRLGDEI